MSHKIFLVAKGFGLAKHYSTLGAFVDKQSRIDKVRQLKPDRCLEFMTENDYSVEFVFRNGIIYARPSIDNDAASELELVLRNIKTYGQLQIVSQLISNDKACELIKDLRNLEKGYYKIYSLPLNKDISVHAKVENNGNTVIFDGEKM